MSSSQRPLRVAVLGLGGAAERIHLPACQRAGGFEVVAACDTDRDRKVLADRYRIPAFYSDPDALLTAESLDVVILGTPPETHRRLCLQAMEARAHVFCEKPFVMTVKEADEVLAEARSTSKLIAVNNQYRHMEIYRRTRERLDAGDFGRLYAIQCWQQMFHPPARENVAWRRRLKQSALFEFGTHALDLMAYFFDALPESIAARMPKVRPEYDSDVLVQATLDFPGDRIASLWLNRVSHAPTKYLEMRLECEDASVRLSLGGVARASVEWRGRPAVRLSLVQGGEARKERGGRSRTFARMMQPAFMAATASHLAQFAERIRRGDLSLSQAEHARSILAAALAGYESAERGGLPVRLH